MDDSVTALVDILKDRDGKVENEARQKLEHVEKVVKEFFEDPDATMGELAFGFSTLSPATLGWYVSILLRDRMEFGV